MGDAGAEGDCDCDWELVVVGDVEGADLSGGGDEEVGGGGDEVGKEGIWGGGGGRGLGEDVWEGGDGVGV